MSNKPVNKRNRLPVVSAGPLHGVNWITAHAASRWRQRSGYSGSDAGLITRLTEMLSESQLAEMDPVERVKYMLRHDCYPATYRLLGEWVFVIEGDTVVTVHRNERGHVRLPAQKARRKRR